MISIYWMVSTQQGLIPQVAGNLTHARLWEATVFVDHYCDYFYYHLMRGTSSEETLWGKEDYDCLVATHGSRVCAYRYYKGRFIDPIFKELVQTCVQHISY